MLSCTWESVSNQSFPFRAHIELSVMGYNSFPRKFDTFVLSGQLSVMILLCCFAHYGILRMLRRSNLEAPCSCPACCRKHAVRAVESSFESDEKNQANRFDSLRVTVTESEIRDSRASEGGDHESQSGYSSALEDPENDQDRGMDRELLDDLQRERETVAALYIELEQERNCSAIAACEAMAMISRLQEEKAAVQMEARQFNRMVEEKTMYDQEAIEVLSELLLSREQERLELEEEIRVCREKLDAMAREERRRQQQQSWLSKAKAGEGRVLPKSKSLSLVRNEKTSDMDSRHGRDEQCKYVDKFCTTSSSQLATAPVQDGMTEQRLSNDIRRKGEKPKEVEKDGLKLQFPKKVDTTPKAGRVEPSKYVDKATPADGPLRSRLVRTLSHGIKSQGEQSQEVDAGGDPEILKSIDVAPKAGLQGHPHDVDELLPAQHSQVSSNASIVQNAGPGMERQLGLRPTASGMSRRGGKAAEVLEDGKLNPEFPGFVSLKRRWGSQEITLKTLEQTREERREEDKKRGSVLEYVLKLERQQKHGGFSHARR